MQEYTEIMIDMIKKYNQEFKNALSNNLHDYCYLPVEDKEHGLHDLNYHNRLRLSYTILFNPQYHNNVETETMIRSLFLEELQDRENNSYQGIGTNLEILTQLLFSYSRTEDIILFEKAKNANFDCACGYDYKQAIYSTEICDYSINQCISISNELEEYDITDKLIKLWKQQKPMMTLADFEALRYWERDRKNIEGELYALEQSLRYILKSKNEKDICFAYQQCIRHLILMENYEKAYRLFHKLISHLRGYKDWYRIGLGRFALEDCMDIILNFSKKSRRLWDWSKPFLLKIKDNMHGNLYQKSAKVAEKMGDNELCKDLLVKYDNLFSGLRS